MTTSKEIDRILEALLQESLPMIERTVNRALQAGRKVHELAFDLERGLDAKVRGGCAPRAAVAKRFQTHPRLTEEKKNEISDRITNAPPDQIPVAMTILGLQYEIVGVKLVEGDLFAPGKAN